MHPKFLSAYWKFQKSLKVGIIQYFPNFTSEIPFDVFHIHDDPHISLFPVFYTL